MAAEIETLGVEGEDYHVVTKNDREIVVPIRKDGDKYHPDPQIRAFQMVHEGRIGGPGRGQGRKRQPRAAEKVADEVRKRADKIVAALDAGLESESASVRLKAAGMALDIEREEAKLTLAEEKQDAELDNMSKEELVATFIQLVSDPQTEAALDIIELPESAVTVIEDDNTEDTAGRDARAAQAPASAQATRPKLRAFGGNGRGAAPHDRQANAGAHAEAPQRRAAN